MNNNKYTNDAIRIAQEIIDGRRLTREDDLSFFLISKKEDLYKGADEIRKSLCGNYVDLCSIINGRSGRCPEDCKFCAQSAHHCTNVKEYPFLSPEEILKDCKYHEEKKVPRYSIVTAGRDLDGEEFETALKAYEMMHKECDIELCASHGLMDLEDFVKLKEAGVKRYHANIETSKAFFPNICSTHTFEDKLEVIKRAKAAGLEVCSGGITGMGETFEDRIDMAFTLKELEIDSIPINVLRPVKGTPFENMEPLSEEEILRTIAMFRYINPEATVRFAAGRNSLPNSGEVVFSCGANAAITGDMLTTSGNNIDDDHEMLDRLGFEY